MDKTIKKIWVFLMAHVEALFECIVPLEFVVNYTCGVSYLMMFNDIHVLVQMHKQLVV
jgi:hypothetical protein